jgi:hypothetical protein
MKKTFVDEPHTAPIEQPEINPSQKCSKEIILLHYVPETLKILTADVISIVNAAIPNKEQNRAVQELIKKKMGKAYECILKCSYPEDSYPNDMVTAVMKALPAFSEKCKEAQFNP